MSEKVRNILMASQAIAIWIVAFAVVVWICFKPNDNLNRETINKLTDAVDKFSVATESMTNLAKAQQEFTNKLNSSVILSQQQRNKGYDDVYKKYGIGDEMGYTSLDDLYGTNGVQFPTEGDGGRDVRRNEDGAGKAGTGEKPSSQPKGQPH